MSLLALFVKFLVRYLFSLFFFSFFFRFSNFADVTPFGVDAQGGLETIRATVSVIARNMTPEDFKYVPSCPVSANDSLFTFVFYSNLLAGLLFTSYAIYVNCSRVDPALLETDNQRIRLCGTRTFSQALMCGVVTASNIISSVTVGGPNNQYRQHRVTIAPFAQEMRRDTSVWGALLNFKVIMATTSHLGFSFITRGEGKAGYSTPCESFIFFSGCGR